MQQIYLDYNATTPVSPEVAETMLPFINDYFGNPSSHHSFGKKTRNAIEIARQQLAELINCNPEEIVFTSGGTESNNFAIRGIAYAHRKKGNHIITSTIEHPAVIEVCRYLEKHGFDITYLPVDENGMANASDLRNAINSRTILITIMHSNNEVGTIQPISEMADIAKKHKIFFHTDAAQSIGKTEVDVKQLGVDLLSIAGHKLYAPKGIGALYIRNGVILEKLMHGADHEQNLRAGTENVIQIAGLGKACEIARLKMEENISHFKQTRDYLHELIKSALPDVKLNGHPEQRLPNTLSLSFPGIEANTLISRLEGVAASAGAACHAETIDVSAVLQAMAVPVSYAMGTLRFSTGRETTMEMIEKAAEEIISKVREMKPDNDFNTVKHSQDDSNFKLTHYTHGLGCACKIEPQKLEQILKNIRIIPHPDILVGTESSDDAAVYRINADTAIVQTLDFFTPIVDDPYDFGAIAAANALSDIYAMGAKPLFALNIVGFPQNVLPMTVLEKILKGATDKAEEAGISIIGGHSIEDPEPKYGLAVTGIVNPGRIIKNFGAKPGDQIILTKPIGTGILTTALKRGLIDEVLNQQLISIMSQLNNIAGELMLNYDISACTDVTGFGLLGHLTEMAEASFCDAYIKFNKIPFINEAKQMAAAGIVPGGTYRNLDFFRSKSIFEELSKTEQLLCFDAQTSGGLMIAINAEDANKLIADFRKAGLKEAEIIGNFTGKGKGIIRVCR